MSQSAAQYTIMNSHTHIFPPKIAYKATQAIGSFYGIGMQASEGLPERLIEDGRPFGVSKYLVCSSATTPEQVTSINDFIADTCAEHPEFIGFGTLHPYMEQPEKEIDRMLALGLRGVKLHPDFQKFDIDDARAIEIYRVLAKSSLPVLFHTGDARYDYSSPVRLRRVLDTLDGFTAIAAHFGGYNSWTQAHAVLKDTNAYFDTSSSLFKLAPDEAADYIRDYGAQRFMFGTDFPMWDHAGELERFMQLPLTQQERVQIFSTTFCRLFGLAIPML